MTAPAPAAGTAARPRTTLRRRLGAALVAAAVVLALVFVGSGIALWRMLDAQDLVTERYFEAITSAETAYTQLVDGETAVRGYALTGFDGTLEPYENAQDATDAFEAVAGSSTSAAVREAAAAAVVAAERWDQEFAQPTIAAVAEGGPSAVTPEEVEGGRALFDEARTAVQEYLDVLRERRDGAAADLAVWTRVVIGSLVALVIAGAVAGAVLWRTLRSWITEPLDALAADTRAVSEGDLHHPVRTAGPGEIADLADAVERMRLGLVSQVQAVEAQRAEIAEAHDRLADQTEELRRSNRDLEQFAYVASHDLQEPLRKVASFTQLLQKRYGGQMDERADQYIAFAVDGAKRMQQLIQDLLGFSRVGRLGGELADVPLDEALGSALDNLEHLVEEAGAVVTYDALPVVRGERPLLVQLLQNLVGNAIKFRDPDRAPEVRITARRVGDSWELECRDNGIGIDPQYAERVFVIFQRLHPKDVYEGTGIGLALCKKIVEYHGGRIWLGDADGPGTSIRWTLPAVAEPEPTDRQDQDGPRAEGSE
ncbi:HAMP domain-containing protein [Cellulomonas hominis]|uniref:histidine kinase n=1 Tax=Cellulomonas hominis TaxID=156981 RepID=A0A7Z8JX64_9CELL|nr:ATP-binding protein [Cellulomonas hominis]TKR22495.1 HAMP domain-containing protein [Cellulomonas hominis]